MKCIIKECNREADTTHHIIFRNKTQSGTDNPENKCPMCIQHHMIIHHGKDMKEVERIKRETYELIRGKLDKCWSSKRGIKPKIIRILESEGY